MNFFIIVTDILGYHILNIQVHELYVYSFFSYINLVENDNYYYAIIIIELCHAKMTLSIAVT